MQGSSSLTLCERDRKHLSDKLIMSTFRNVRILDQLRQLLVTLRGQSTFFSKSEKKSPDNHNYIQISRNKMNTKYEWPLLRIMYVLMYQEFILCINMNVYCSIVQSRGMKSSLGMINIQALRMYSLESSMCQNKSVILGVIKATFYIFLDISM